MSAFVGLGGRRGSFVGVGQRPRSGFASGVGREVRTTTDTAPHGEGGSWDGPRAGTAAPHSTATAAPGPGSGDNEGPEVQADPPGVAEPSPAELAFAESEALRAREHAMLLAELEAERKRVRDSAARLGQLAGELVRLRAQAIQQLRDGAGPLMVEGARALATEGLRAQPELLARLVDDACELVGRVGARVFVNPADAERLSELLAPSIEVVADPAVQAGCVCEGPTGKVDRRVEAGAAALAAESAAWRDTA